MGSGPAAIEAAFTARLYTNDVVIVSEKPTADWSKLSWTGGLLHSVGGSWQEELEETESLLQRWSDDLRNRL